jgi:hypothetical protein
MTNPSFTKLAATVWPAAATDTDKDDIHTYGLEIEAALNALFSRTPIINGTFVPSVGSNVLTIAIKTLAGADPSATDPVYVDFRHATQTNGQGTVLEITAAVSFTMSAGATGGFTDGIHGRLWVVLFNDASTPRIGVMNAYGGAGGVIHPLYPSLVATSTDEAGDGSADSAGVIYTDTAVTSKSFVVLGHMTWETVLATAGLWSAAPDVVHQQRFGDRLPGDLIQRRATETAAVATGTTTMALDDTIPQNTEGDEIQTQAIVPESAANILEIAHEGAYASSVANALIGAIFQDSTAGALAARSMEVSDVDATKVLLLSHRMLAATVSSTTLKVRAGPSSAATVTFNGANAARTFGGVNTSRLEIVERMA